MRVRALILTLAAIAGLARSAVGQLTTIVNGGFESGFTSWTHTGDVQIAKDHPRTGTNLAAFGAGNGTQAGILQQTVRVPNTPATLSFWLSINSVFNDTVARQTFTCELLDTRGDLLETLQVFTIRGRGDWYEQSSFPLDAYANRTIIIQFRGACGTSYPATFLLDDVNVTTATTTATGITGSVTDKNTGAPLAGATATFATNTATTSTATTTSSGQYVFGSIACQTGTLTVAKSGYRVWQEQYTPVCGTKNTHDIQLTPIQRTTVISGRVTNIVTGAAVPVVTITFGLVTTQSNQFGGYSLIDVDCQTSVITAQAAGYQPWQEPFTPACGTSTIVNIVLIPIGATSIEGIVTNAYTHEPVAGVTVNSYHTSTTDSAGRYQIYVEGCRPGNYLRDVAILLTKTNWTNQNPHYTLTCGIANEENIEYVPWTVGGQIFDAITHKLIAGVTVTWGAASTTTHEVGGYFFSALCQNATLTATMTGYRSFSEKLNEFCPLTSSMDVPPITLTPTATNIFVNVVDGSPLANGAAVTYANVQWGAYAVSGQEDQSYGLFNVVCQSALLTVSVPYYGTVQQTYTPKCGTSNLVTISLSRSSADIEGQVTDRVSQAPLAAATVRWGTYTTTTNKDGVFRLRQVPCGLDTLTVSMPLYESLAHKAEASCTKPRTWLQWPLQPTTTTISGIVSSSAHGPLNGATVTWGTSTTKTDSKGKYQLTSIPCQAGTLTASMTGYSTAQITFTPSCQTSNNSKNVTLTP